MRKLDILISEINSTQTDSLSIDLSNNTTFISIRNRVAELWPSENAKFDKLLEKKVFNVS